MKFFSYLIPLSTLTLCGCLTPPEAVKIEYLTIADTQPVDCPYAAFLSETFSANRKELAVIEEPGTIKFLEELRWEAPPSRLLNRSLQQTLRNQTAPHQEVELKLLHFEYLQLKKAVRLAVKYRLHNTDTGSISSWKDFETTVDCENPATAGQAMSQAVNQLAGALAKPEQF